MRFDQLTIKAQEAVQEAQSDARARGNAELTPDHLLLALLRQDEGVVVPILQKLGVDPSVLAREVEADLDARPKVTGASADAILSPDLNKVFDRAFEVAKEFGDEYVSGEHFLLALAEKVGAQLVFAVDRGGELDDVGLPHAGHPVQALGPIGGEARDHQHRRDSVQPGTASQGMRATTGPASHQAVFGADAGQDSGSVGGHVHDGPAWLAA